MANDNAQQKSNEEIMRFAWEHLIKVHHSFDDELDLAACVAAPFVALMQIAKSCNDLQQARTVLKMAQATTQILEEQVAKFNPMLDDFKNGLT